MYIRALHTGACMLAGSTFCLLLVILPLHLAIEQDNFITGMHSGAVLSTAAADTTSFNSQSNLQPFNFQDGTTFSGMDKNTGALLMLKEFAKHLRSRSRCNYDTSQSHYLEAIQKVFPSTSTNNTVVTVPLFICRFLPKNEAPQFLKYLESNTDLYYRDTSNLSGATSKFEIVLAPLKAELHGNATVLPLPARTSTAFKTFPRLTFHQFRSFCSEKEKEALKNSEIFDSRVNFVVRNDLLVEEDENLPTGCSYYWKVSVSEVSGSWVSNSGFKPSSNEVGAFQKIKSTYKTFPGSDIVRQVAPVGAFYDVISEVVRFLEASGQDPPSIEDAIFSGVTSLGFVEENNPQQALPSWLQSKKIQYEGVNAVELTRLYRPDETSWDQVIKRLQEGAMDEALKMLKSVPQNKLPSLFGSGDDNYDDSVDNLFLNESGTKQKLTKLNQGLYIQFDDSYDTSSVFSLVDVCFKPLYMIFGLVNPMVPAVFQFWENVSIRNLALETGKSSFLTQHQVTSLLKMFGNEDFAWGAAFMSNSETAELTTSSKDAVSLFQLSGWFTYILPTLTNFHEYMMPTFFPNRYEVDLKTKCINGRIAGDAKSVKGIGQFMDLDRKVFAHNPDLDCQVAKDRLLTGIEKTSLPATHYNPILFDKIYDPWQHGMVFQPLWYSEDPSLILNYCMNIPFGLFAPCLDQFLYMVIALIYSVVLVFWLQRQLLATITRNEKRKGLEKDDSKVLANAVKEHETLVLSAKPELLDLKGVCLDKVHKVYAGNDTHAVRGVSWAGTFLTDPDEGEENKRSKGNVFGLLGANGGGKSTLFKMMLGLESISSGDIHINGLNTSLDMKKIYRNCGYCPQQNTVPEDETVQALLTLFGSIKLLDSARVESEVEQKMRRLDISQYRDRKFKHLSGGNKRKVMIAIALLGDPKIVFLDEPSAGVDPAARQLLRDVIRQAASGNSNLVIMTTHVMEEAAELCREMALQASGTWFDVGSPEHLRSAHVGDKYLLRVRSVDKKDTCEFDLDLDTFLEEMEEKVQAADSFQNVKEAVQPKEFKEIEDTLLYDLYGVTNLLEYIVYRFAPTEYMNIVKDQKLLSNVVESLYYSKATTNLKDFIRRKDNVFSGYFSLDVAAIKAIILENEKEIKRMWVKEIAPATRKRYQNQKLVSEIQKLSEAPLEEYDSFIYEGVDLVSRFASEANSYISDDGGNLESSIVEPRFATYGQPGLYDLQLVIPRDALSNLVPALKNVTFEITELSMDAVFQRFSIRSANIL